VLVCTPSYALRLAEVAQELGINLRESSVHTTIHAGEPGTSIPATRERIEGAWGAHAYDHAGMTEMGAYGFACSQQSGVHVNESEFIVEILDLSSGQPVKEGETGELVLTNLGRVGSPLLRYRTGDLVKPSAAVPCVCGRFDLALEGGILGRTDDMVIVRSVNLYPAAVEEVLRAFGDVAEYRVEISTPSTMAELTLLLEPAPDCLDPDALGEAVAAALRSAFNLRIPISLVSPGALPRFELKARRWVRKE